MSLIEETVPDVVQALRQKLKNALSTLRCIEMKLGWGNSPPSDVLIKDINVRLDRGARAEILLGDLICRLEDTPGLNLTKDAWGALKSAQENCPCARFHFDIRNKG